MVVSGNGMRTLWVVLGMLAVAGAARATPEQDFSTGREAFYRGDLMGAMPLLRRASDQGHTQAQVLLAYILDRAEEDEEAARLYRAAAEKGDVEAMFGLASMYAAGEGVAQDDAAAVQWFTRAMEGGHAHARYVLANAHLDGTLGLPRSEEQGMEMLRASAAAGYQPARERLQALNKAKAQ